MFSARQNLKLQLAKSNFATVNLPRRRVGALALTAAILLGAITSSVFANSAAALTTFVDTYPHYGAVPHNVSAYEWWVDENNDRIRQIPGELRSSRGYDYRNCTDGAAYWVGVYTGVGVGNWSNAHNWNEAAATAGHTVKGGNSNTIEPGDVAQSDDGSYGHVGFVTSVEKDPNGVVTAFTAAELNKSGNGEFSLNTYRQKNNSGKFVRGSNDWDHFIDVNGGNRGLNNEPLTQPAPVVTNEFYMNDDWDTTHNLLTTYGDPGVPALVGDWDGDGVRTLAVRYGNVYYLNNSWDATADFTVAYGDHNSEVLAGDWDGDGDETLGVRYGNVYYLDNQFDGVADLVTSYGSASDAIFAGDWDGDGDDSLGIRPANTNTFYLNNNFDAAHDILTSYGNTNQSAIVGDWDGNGTDTLGVRSGNAYYLNNNWDGAHDRLTTYGSSLDHVVVGDWNNNSVDTLGIRRVE